MFLSSVNQNKKQGYLLLDETTVAAASDCHLQFFQAAKDPASPMITATEKWEGCGPYTWSSRIFYLPEQEKYRLYYMSYQDKGNHYRTGAAESVDGLNWTKPTLFERQYEGETNHYCMQTTGYDEEFNICKPARSVTYDPRPECPPDKRYKSMCFSYQGNHVFYSADGYTWECDPGNPVWHGTSDIIHCMWDQQLQKFVVYYKLWKLFAYEKDDTSPDGCRKIEAYYTTFDPVARTDGWTEFTGPRVYFQPGGASVVKNETILIRSGDLSSDDGGGGHLIGAWYTKRVVCRSESDDFLHWEFDQEVLGADELDRPDANIQIAQVFTMGGYYLAFLTMHDQRGFFDVQLAFSQDGISWKRPWRGNLISHGAPGQFDHGLATTPADPIITETQMLLYYGGSTGDHTELSSTYSIGRAVMRRDGFACRRAEGDTAGQLTTVPQSRKYDALYLNADAEGGWVTAALLDKQGNPIPGFTHENCAIIRDDSASHPDCFTKVIWNGQTGLPACDQFQVDLRFQNASIYSILI